MVVCAGIPWSWWAAAQLIMQAAAPSTWKIAIPAPHKASLLPALQQVLDTTQQPSVLYECGSSCETCCWCIDLHSQPQRVVRPLPVFLLQVCIAYSEGVHF